MSYGNPQLVRKVPDVPAFLVGYGERGWFGNQGSISIRHQGPQGRAQALRAPARPSQRPVPYRSRFVWVGPQKFQFLSNLSTILVGF